MASCLRTHMASKKCATFFRNSSESRIMELNDDDKGPGSSNGPSESKLVQ